jgi:CHASE2 domain-containing sensor protein
MPKKPKNWRVRRHRAHMSTSTVVALATALVLAGWLLLVNGWFSR